MSTMDYQDDTLVDYSAEGSFLEDFEVDLAPLTGSPEYKKFVFSDELYNTKAENEDLRSENEKLRSKVAQLEDTNRITGEAIRNFQAATELANRLKTQIADLQNQLQIKRSMPHAELDNLEEKIQKLEEENATLRSWNEITSPTYITPITPPKRKLPMSLANPRTPHKKNPRAKIIYAGGKVKSIDADLQKACAKSQFYQRDDSTEVNVSIAPEYKGNPELAGLAPERRWMVHPDEFEAVQEAYAAEREWASSKRTLNINELFKPAITAATSPKNWNWKTIDQLFNPPTKMVPKKQAGRKTANKAAPKPAPYRLINRESSDDPFLEITSKNRLTGAGAQAPGPELSETEKEDTESEYADDSSLFEAGDYEGEDWSTKCRCGGKNKDTADIQCTLCENWGHMECYKLNAGDVTKDFVHLCPDHEAEADEQRAATMKNLKRKRDSDDESSQNDNSEYDEPSGNKSKKQRPNAWTEEEKHNLKAAMSIHFDLVNDGYREQVYDANLFKAISQDLSDMGIFRNANACKNIWNRELRAATGLDERRQKNPSKLSTSVQ